MHEKKNCSRKLLIIGIFILFVGASAVTGFSVKINKQTSNSIDTSSFVSNSDTAPIFAEGIDVIDPIEFQNSGRGDDDDWDYWTNPPNMFSNVTGNVGIGTSIPTEKLEVIGNIKATSYYGDGGNLTGIVITEFDPIFVASAAYGITLADILNWDTAYGWGDHSTAGYDSSDDSWTGTGDVYTTSGNVGIGTTNPTNLLHIAGSASVPLVNIEQSGSHRGLRVNTTNACAIWVDNAGNHGLRITHANGDGVHITSADGDGIYVESAGGWAGYFNGDGFFGGNVGIGTTTPDSPLEVAGIIHSSSGGFQFPDGTIQTTASTGGGGAGNTLDQAYDQGGAGAGRTIIADSGPVNIIGSDGLTVNGNVGINKTIPVHELDVKGEVQADGFIGDDITFKKDGMEVWRIYADLYYLYLQNMITGSKYIFVLAASGGIEDTSLSQTGSSIILEQEIENLKAENEELQQRINNLENAIYQIFKLRVS